MSDLVIKIGDIDPKRRLEFKKALDGKIIVFDHPYLDIVIDSSKQKISTFAKDTFGDHVYDSQDQLFKSLMKDGVINYDSVHAGNVFNAMEAKYLSAANNREPLDEVLLAIKKHIDEVLPYYKAMEKYEETWEQSLVNGDDESTTSLGEVPQRRKQGSVQSSAIRSQIGVY